MMMRTDCELSIEIISHVHIMQGEHTRNAVVIPTYYLDSSPRTRNWSLQITATVVPTVDHSRLPGSTHRHLPPGVNEDVAGVFCTIESAPT